MNIKIIVTLALFLIVEGGAAIWWGSGMNSKVIAQEKQIIEMNAKVKETDNRQRVSNEALVRIDERTKAIQEMLANINRSLQKP